MKLSPTESGGLGSRANSF